MSRPANPPDFRSGTPYAAWFGVNQRVGGQLRVRLCATQGRSFIRRLQRRLQALYPSAGIQVTGRWDQSTASYLANYATRLYEQNPGSGWSVYAEQLRQAERDRRVTPLALRFALWTAYLDGTQNSFDDTVVYDGTVYPQWDVAPEDDRDFGGPDGAATCWYEDTEAAPTASQTPGQSGTNRPGEAPMPGSLAPVPAPSEGMNPLWVAAIVGGTVLVLGGTVAVIRARSKGKGRKSKSRSKSSRKALSSGKRSSGKRSSKSKARSRAA